MEHDEDKSNQVPEEKYETRENEVENITAQETLLKWAYCDGL